MQFDFLASRSLKRKILLPESHWFYYLYCGSSMQYPIIWHQHEKTSLPDKGYIPHTRAIKLIVRKSFKRALNHKQQD